MARNGNGGNESYADNTGDASPVAPSISDVAPTNVNPYGSFMNTDVGALLANIKRPSSGSHGDHKRKKSSSSRHKSRSASLGSKPAADLESRFKKEVASLLVERLSRFHKKGAIPNKEDFKYLARKYTDKALSVEHEVHGSFELTDKKKEKLKAMIDGYFAKHPIFVRTTEQRLKSSQNQERRDKRTKEGKHDHDRTHKRDERRHHHGSGHKRTREEGVGSVKVKSEDVDEMLASIT
jgi:hypothetical protein